MNNPNVVTVDLEFYAALTNAVVFSHAALLDTVRAAENLDYAMRALTLVDPKNETGIWDHLPRCKGRCVPQVSTKELARAAHRAGFDPGFIDFGG